VNEVEVFVLLQALEISEEVLSPPTQEQGQQALARSKLLLVKGCILVSFTFLPRAILKLPWEVVHLLEWLVLPLALDLCLLAML
jgi:hypothetical protein